MHVRVLVVVLDAEACLNAAKASLDVLSKGDSAMLRHASDAFLCPALGCTTSFIYPDTLADGIDRCQDRLWVTSG